MANSISSVTTGTGGIVLESVDTSGNTNIKSGTTTIVAVSSTGAAVTGTLSASGGIAKASLPTGSVLQVVNATYNTSTSTTSTSGVTTGLTASITPTSATSKILVLFNVNGLSFTSAANGNVYTDLRRNGSVILSAATGSQFGTAYVPVYSVGSNYLDSPATTSSTTYAVFFSIGGGANPAYVQMNGEKSAITLLEIAA